MENVAFTYIVILFLASAIYATVPSKITATVRTVAFVICIVMTVLIARFAPPWFYDGVRAFYNWI